MLDNVFKERDQDGSNSPPPPSSGKRSLLSTALLLPLLFLLLLGLIVTLFGWISFDRRSAIDLAEEIRASSGERRALVAFELSRLESLSLSGADRSRFLSEVQDLLRNETSPDPRVKRALAIALGRMGDASSVPALLEAVEDPDPETKIYCVWALGIIRDSRALDSLISHLHHEDPSVRKTAAFALGELGDTRATTPLKVALQDSAVDVGWNAAVALARLGDEAALPTLLPLLGRSMGATALTPAREEELLVNAIRSLKGFRQEAALAALRGVASLDPSPRVRSEARLALEGRSAPPFGPVRDVSSPR